MTTQALRPNLLRLAKRCLEEGLSHELKRHREAMLVQSCKSGKFNFYGVSKYKYIVPEGEAIWSTNQCLQQWLEAAKNDKQLDLFEGI